MHVRRVRVFPCGLDSGGRVYVSLPSHLSNVHVWPHSCAKVPLHPCLPNVPLRTLYPKRVRIVTLGPSSHARTRPHARESPPMHARTSTPVPLSHARTTPSAPVPLTRARTEGLTISGPHLRGVKSPTRSCNPNFTREKMEGRSENLRILS